MRKLKLQELGRINVEAFKTIPKTPLIIVLDNIRSGLNVGSGFRTADAFALNKIVLTGISAKPPHREILKTAIGATEAVDWEYYESVEEAAMQLKKEGWELIAIEQTDESVPLQEFEIDPKKKYVLILGNEVRGVSDQVLPLVDHAVEVPQFGTKHSLNIAVCLGIVCWHFFKHLKFN